MTTSSARLLGGPGVWTQVSTGIGGSAQQPALLRTSDGKLHVAWVEGQGTDWSVGYTTFSAAGVKLNTGLIKPLEHWQGFNPAVALVPDGKGVRLVFNGAQDGNPGTNVFSRQVRYTATSTDGVHWTLVHGSLSSHDLLNANVTATAEANGTVVSEQANNTNLYYHVGVDTSAFPSSTSDSVITGQVGSEVLGASLVRDGSSIYLGWWQGFESGQGYYVEKILPSAGAKVKAPNSGNAKEGDNEPFEQVALAARAGGGTYLAYCQETKLLNCADVALWKVGSKTVRVVPGSKTGGSVKDVTLSAGPGGRMVIGWYNISKNVIDVIRTNTKVTAFSAERVVKLPSSWEDFDNLYSQSSTGRIDLVADALTSKSTQFFHTQVLPAMRVTVSPSSFSHKKTTKLTFKVTDAGEAVVGAKVTFLGKTAKTNAKGVATITIAKGKAPGTHSASVTRTNYAVATVKVKVT